MNDTYKTVLFDLDGTLLDTTPLIMASFRHTLDRHCPGQYGDKEILACLGEPLLEQMKKLGGEEEAEAMVKTYREHNIAHHDDYVEAFPGVAETLDRMYQAGICMGVVSNKQRRTVEMGLALCDLEKYMSVVVCNGDTPRPKPDPSPIRKAVEGIGANPSSTLMVGDTRYDLQAAKRAGVAAAGVAWSHGGAEALKAYQPDVLLERMTDLLPIVGIEPDKGARE
ncbi:pyrophosphatase PpaX [Paludifilum halophilum]|uniref:Pyrophosphatase PpaX n=1 Tax=Paludifilum halophilum TaxID=1642702 RepID=A0A235B751_9BACL|nr:pyrophosphatase PpaX [Paludifilum halophilum]OYD08130.1 pyrophosphatase PpaX [Paludifilum halophilum]